MDKQRSSKMWSFVHDRLHEIYRKLRETGGHEEYHLHLHMATDKFVEEIEGRFCAPPEDAPVVAWKAEWVMTVPVVSNRHIPKELAEWLREHEFDEDVADMHMGWMICVHTNIDYVDLDPWGAMERLKQFMKLNYPELIADGLAWIRFDVDGDEYVGLEDYDW